MEAKLPLHLDKNIFDRVARDQLVAGGGEPRKLPGIVGELAGVLAGAEVAKPKAEYAEYLEKKYS